MDSHEKGQSEHRPEIPVNAPSYSCPVSSHQKESPPKSTDNEIFNSVPEYPVYCMSDSSGRLHFKLNVYSQSALDPSEQKDLGRQLSEYIRDHYDQFQRNHDQFKESFHAGFDSFSPLLLQSLYDDFTTHHPGLSVSYETYFTALNYESSAKMKALNSKSPVHVAQTCSTEEQRPEPTSSPLPSHQAATNPSASDMNDSRREESDGPVKDGRNQNYEETEALFFNRLNICRKRNNSKSPNHDDRPSVTKESSFSLESLSSSFHGKLRSIQKLQLHPLSPKCSCPVNKCSTVFPEKERQLICKRFWCGRTSRGNLKWIGASVHRHFLRYHRPHSRPKHGRPFLIGRYFLHKPAVGRQAVCKHFFLSTLGLRFSFPIYDLLRQGASNNVTSKGMSLESHSRTVRSKRKAVLKHFMKRHIRKYFLHRCFQKNTAPSIMIPQIKRSFRHFAFQYPHLLDGRSFKKYLSIICKILNSKKYQANGPVTSSSSTSISHTSKGEHGNKESEHNHELDVAASGTYGSVGAIMKIKPEDFDEVIADDLAEKFKVAANKNKAKRQLNPHAEKQSLLLSMNSDAATAVSGHKKRKRPQVPSDDETNQSVPQLCSELPVETKKTKRPYTKRKGKASQKKIASGKPPAKKGRPPLSSYPKKVYKIAVNELEDDESKHPMLPACNCTKSKCVSKVSEEQRHVIHVEFWGLDNISRRTWMVKHVHILKPKSRSNRATARLHKMHRKFYLPDSNGVSQDVCKKFFLGTLGFKGVGVLRPQKIPGVNSSTPQVEPRKRILSYQVCQQDVIRVIQYCRYFNQEKNVSICVDERFTRAASNDIISSEGRHQKICVPYGFTWKELYKDYCSKHRPVDFGYQTFRSILSLVEHNNFSEDVLEKFQSFAGSNSVEVSSKEEEQDADSVPSDPYQVQYQILQTFPKSQKPPPKPTVTKEPSSSSKIKVEKEKPRKTAKHHKKLKLSKSFLSHDFTQSVKQYKERNTRSSRYNFREGVPLVSYAIEPDAAIQVDDDYLSSNDWEDSGYDGIKEEVPSEEEKSNKSKPGKKAVKKVVGKKRGRKPGKKKTKHRSPAVATSDVEQDVASKEKDPSLKTTSQEKTKKIVRRGRKKSWNLKIDMKQRESTMRFKNRHPILPPCKCNYRKCHEKIPEPQREKIHSLYWGISNKQDRCKWVLEHIQRCSPKTRSNTGLPSRKRETRRYFFPNEEDEIIEVCRVFFLRTLGYQWDSVVDTVSRALPRPGGHLAKSLGFSEEQLPYEVIVKIKTLLKRKKIKKSSITAAEFPKKSDEGDLENDEEDKFTLGGHTMGELFAEFGELHPEQDLEFQAFKQIVRFILVPGSETQSEWEIKQELLNNTSADGGKGDRDIASQPDGTDGGGPESSVVYFTPEFEKLDVEKALTRKARRRRPVSARNCKEQHPMREPCQCIRKCRDKIDQAKREEIHEQYWDLITYNQRKQWILEHIKREAPKRRTNLNGPIKKMETRKFYLEDWSGQMVEICKGFFLSTLGFKWDKMVDTICKTTPRDGQYVRPDQRGKKPPSHKLSETLISSVTNYVESILETASCIYPKATSRTSSGKQKKAPERMPYGLTMKNLFEDYKIKHPNHKVGYESFRKIYRSVIQSEKFQPLSASSPQAQDDDDDDEPDEEPLSRPAQHIPPVSMLVTNMNSSSSERANEQDVPNFETAPPQSCMYNKNQVVMRINNPEHAHLSSYQRQCEPSVMKSFPEGINSFPKSHDVQFYPPGLEQSEEMSMQMFKSICLPSSNPNQAYPFYPNSLPLDTFHMNSGSQGLHGGLPYSESLRHSDLMHHHAYQPPAHHHFSQGRFHGFVLPGSSGKETEPGGHHHLHAEMNLNPNANYRNEFDCNPYPGKPPLLYPPAYPAAADNMASSSAQRHAFNNIPMQAHGMHEIRVRDSAPAAIVPSAPANQLISDSSLSNSCHVPNSIPNPSSHPPSVAGNEWGSHLAPSPNKIPDIEGEGEKKVVRRTKGRPTAKRSRAPKEKVPKPKIKKEKKVRPKSNRNSREYNPMLPPCGCSVKKCLEKIPEPRREFIYNMFWDLGCYNKRKQWIAEHIVREDPKRRTSLDNPLRRMETRRFFLPNEEGEKLEVCKGFFLRTLGFKWDKMVDTICKTTEKGQTTVRPDMRGKKGPSRKLNTEVASSVESYVRSILQAAKPAYEAVADQSEEQLEQNSDKDIFVPYGLTMKNFHEDYKGKHAHHKVGYESFRKIFRRVSKEVLDSVSLREDEKGNLMPTSTKGKTHVINPITGLPQEEPE